MDNNKMDDEEELGPDFFEAPILTRPGESLVDTVQRERKRSSPEVEDNPSEH